jgi:hypothetical protein
MPYLERYRSGEREQVWRELVDLGSAVREKPLYNEAQMVAEETMQRARYNVDLIVQRLQSLAYRFAVEVEHPTFHQMRPWEPLNKKEVKRLEKLEQRYGMLPLSLSNWYRIVGFVNLMGAHPRLSHYGEWQSVEQLPIASDPLVVGPVPSNLSEVYFSYKDQNEYPSPPYTLAIAPDLTFKAGAGGDGPLEIHIPNQAIDAQLVCNPSSGWNGVYFVDHLRTMFKYGGFAGLARLEHSADFPSEEIAFLTKDLLPI